ncbi:hypothetical protein GCM10009802_13690 [Streptomyces synnematoformans]|uniref:Uncharacterized protein n=1 Tax=Streptomyces synnematoformans TaxID=415721 RepID=A0ABP5JBT0_9ACTN
MVLPLAAVGAGGLLPGPGLGTEYGSDGLLVVLVTGGGAVFSDPTRQLVRGV